ncbi:MAG: type II toxin-antitoxin system RelE/ParE family toxin [Sulfuricellaceae bacterium]|nr:type II toxin-antitoxin system RelE/ParE family toxin [Sulfuricellaceae bacterium]
MVWQIDLAETAVKQLAKLDIQTAKRITTFLRERIAPLDDPRSAGKALKGPLGSFWRYRLGDYRVICDIQDNAVRVLVVEIGNRREVYR